MRAAAAFAVPAAIVVATGHAGSALFVMFGAFSVLYGERRPYRVRAGVVLTAGAGLLAAAVVGIAVGGVVSGSGWGGFVEVLVLTAIAVLAVYIVDAARLGPPGALFFVLVCSGATAAAQAGASSVAIVVCTVIGIGASVITSMAGVLTDRGKPERTAVAAAVHAVDAFESQRAEGRQVMAARHTASAALAEAWAAVYDAGLPDRTPESELVTTLRAAHRRAADATVDLALGDSRPGPDDSSPEPDGSLPELDDSPPAQWIPLAGPSLRYRLKRSFSLDSHAATTTARVAVACLLGGTLGVVIGSAHPAWAVITAVIILNQGPSRVRGRVRALHRFAGTVAGLLVFAGLSQLSLTGYVLIAMVAALQFGIEIFMPRNYALAVVFVTPVALLAGGAALAGTTATMADRLLETAIGVAISILVLQLLLPKAHRRTFAWTATRVRSASRSLLDRLSTRPIDDTSAELRRDLQFELSGCVRSGIDCANDDPDWTTARWSTHTALIHNGFDLLAACWAAQSSPDRTVRWPKTA